MDNSGGNIVNSDGARIHDNSQTHSANRSYNNPSTPSSTPTKKRERSPVSRRWVFGCCCFPKRVRQDSAPIRDSVRYPSNASFEDTIVKGTAWTSRRYPIKPRLVDLRRKIHSVRRSVSHHNLKTGLPSATASSSRGIFEEHPLEQLRTQSMSRQTTTEADREALSDTSSSLLDRFPSPPEPQGPFCDKIPDKHFSGATKRLKGGDPEEKYT
ncbi:uncharacterized protein F4822DRAFT_342365 [Hypoxylon trugodes]|uniref:uncharacterized protein n=1 Tax=Hypoxylon trugodes TaxID=326681 RepID=UPI002197F4A7|nr:uncharacterized protein F4822DRAFT_342365 [Hypoxylon trugodes]KAI1385366.1 hypothetical protein F4822DRAFT_342365 [Hypoxylon trugodes]